MKKLNGDELLLCKACIHAKKYPKKCNGCSTWLIREIYRLKALIWKPPEVDMKFVETWAKEFASLEFLPLVPLHPGDKFMPAYIIKVKNMLIEAGVKIKDEIE